jgi:ribosomal protein L7Ae-like RNA K-turn-binding protein
MENEMQRDKLLGMLGLAMRAGRVCIGTEMVCTSLAKSGGAKPALVLISEEASPQAKKKLTLKCQYYGVEYLIIDIEMTELGRLLGKTYAPAAVAITDAGFGARIKELSGIASDMA